MKQLKCLRCGTMMVSMGTEKIQKGQATFFTGIWSNIFAGAIRVELFRCPTCGKLEFFDVSAEYAEYDCGEKPIPRKTCTACTAEYDGTCDCCPICGHPSDQ